jgi:hypothetical protein
LAQVDSWRIEVRRDDTSAPHGYSRLAFTVFAVLLLVAVAAAVVWLGTPPAKVTVHRPTGKGISALPPCFPEKHVER